MKHKIFVVISTVLLVLAGVVVAPQAANAVSCYGDYCSGKDPISTGCANDAYTVTSVSNNTGILEVRWSPTCKTNWARWTAYPIGWCFGCNYPYSISAVQDTGYTQRFNWPANKAPVAGQTYWTAMIYSPVRRVYAVALLNCGSSTIVGAAFDCATNGKIQTRAV
jgi:hypothetical protein